MSVELLYTSAPKGLRQGSRGFCTVLSTAGTPVNLATRLESLSGYRHLFATDSPQANSNPVAYSHLKFSLAGQSTSVISRISAYGSDYSGRTNKLAHHVVVDRAEQPAAGPAWLLQQPALMRESWDGNCETPAQGPSIPQADRSGGLCKKWQEVTGDAGWGGVVAQAFAQRGGKPTWIVYEIEQQHSLLELLGESTALLPIDRRWNATFSTYAAQLPPDIDCRVRCVVEGTEEAKFAAAKGQVVWLRSKPLQLPGSNFIDAARGAESAHQPMATTSASGVPLPQPTTRQAIPQSTHRKTEPPATPAIAARQPSLPTTQPSLPTTQPLPPATQQESASTHRNPVLTTLVGITLVVAGASFALMALKPSSNPLSKSQQVLTDPATSSETFEETSTETDTARIDKNRENSRELPAGPIAPIKKDPIEDDSTTSAAKKQSKLTDAQESEEASPKKGSDPKPPKKTNNTPTQPPIQPTDEIHKKANGDESTTARSRPAPQKNVLPAGDISTERIWYGEYFVIFSIHHDELFKNKLTRWDWIRRDDPDPRATQARSKSPANTRELLWIPDRKDIVSKLEILAPYENKDNGLKIEAAFHKKAGTIWFRAIAHSTVLGDEAVRINEIVEQLCTTTRIRKRNADIRRCNDILERSPDDRSHATRQSFESALNFLRRVPTNKRDFRDNEFPAIFRKNQAQNLDRLLIKNLESELPNEETLDTNREELNHHIRQDFKSLTTIYDLLQNTKGEKDTGIDLVIQRDEVSQGSGFIRFQIACQVKSTN